MKFSKIMGKVVRFSQNCYKTRAHKIKPTEEGRDLRILVDYRMIMNHHCARAVKKYAASLGCIRTDIFDRDQKQ